MGGFACAGVFGWFARRDALLGRALTDNILKTVQGAWRGRQNASAVMSVVDSFFTATLRAMLQHEIHERDMDLPLHSDRTHKLLADNTTAMSMSYTVY